MYDMKRTETTASPTGPAREGAGGVSFPGAKIRVGVLGCSDVARRKFLPALMKTDKAALAAVASRTSEKARGFAPDRGCEILTYDELVDHRDVDLIYLSLPNHLHEPWAIRALERGKHVICEKPLACSRESAERMTACARKQGRLLYENIMYLHHPQHAAVKKIVASGRLGKLRILRAAFGFHFTKQDNFRAVPEMGGGAFLDQFRYPLSAAFAFLSGDFVECQGFSLRRKGLNIGMQGYAITTGKELFDFSIGFEQAYESYYELVGESGTLRLDRAFTTPADFSNTIYLNIDSRQIALAVPPADHFERMLSFVCETIAERRDFEPFNEAALRLARVSEWMKAACRDVALAPGAGAP